MKYFNLFGSITALVVSVISYQRGDIQTATYFLIWMAYLGIKFKLEDSK